MEAVERAGVDPAEIDDCLIGCDFILKMDPRFAPARQLMEKAKNPSSEVDVAKLEALVSETPTRQERVASAETDRLFVRAAESFNARDFDAAVATAEQVLQALPGNQDATEILRKAREKKNAQPQFEVARQRAWRAEAAAKSSTWHLYECGRPGKYWPGVSSRRWHW